MRRVRIAIAIALVAVVACTDELLPRANVLDPGAGFVEASLRAETTGPGKLLVRVAWGGVQGAPALARKDWDLLRTVRAVACDPARAEQYNCSTTAVHTGTFPESAEIEVPDALTVLPSGQRQIVYELRSIGHTWATATVEIPDDDSDNDAAVLDCNDLNAEVRDCGGGECDEPEGSCDCSGQIAGKNCDRCVDSHRLPPSCVACAPAFTGSYCTQCKNPRFTGLECDRCADARFTGAACDKCADARYTGANCDQCANPRFDGALCDQCVNPRFAGAACDRCVERFAGQNCDVCADTRFAAPECTSCTDPHFAEPTCRTCRPKFSGEDCDQCADARYDGIECDHCADPRFTGANCDQCADARFKGVNCDQCTDPLATGAACDRCLDTRYKGANCDQCADSRFTGAACDQCADPHFAAPLCTACTTRFTGAGCQLCSVRFGGTDCLTCADPHFVGPECNQCWSLRFAGANCDVCAEGVGGADCSVPQWALWRMPHPAGSGPNPAHYTVFGAHVIDDVTGLVWQRASSAAMEGALAKGYCENLVLDGFADWRLPSRIELVSLVDFTHVLNPPAIDTVAFPNTPSENFWTASPSVLSADAAWVVQFSVGQTIGFGVYQNAYVRCVR